MVRLFIALHLPETITSRLAEMITTLKPTTKNVRWVKPENIHLTLKFIGEVEESLVTPISAALDALKFDWSRLTVRLDKCGGFPNLKQPRVLWVGLSGAEAAVTMAAAINKALTPLGIEPDRKKFSPHVTLGRVKQPVNTEAVVRTMNGLSLSSEPVILDRVALVESTLTPSGSIYTDRHNIELE